MFKRPHTSKTSSPLRSSDARKIREELSTDFYLDPALVKILLPDVHTHKITTHLGEPCQIYSPSSSGNPLFFRHEKGALIPTCYAFDLLPELLPTLVTAPQVVEHLISGAALFSTGISDASLRFLPTQMMEGSLVAIVAEGSRDIVAVGQLTASQKELWHNREGKAVLTLHARGDFLWKTGSQTTAERLVPEESRPGTPESDSDSAPSLADLTLDPFDPICEPTLVEPAPPEPAPSEALTPAEVDTILRTALLLAIQSALGKQPALFPLPASSLYSAYILPFRPAHAAAADIKKSSFKKLAPFLKVAAKAGVLVTKEVKGDLIVMSVNKTHPDVDSVRGYKTIAQAGASAEKAAASAAAIPSGIVVQELYKASSSVLPLFLHSPYPRPENDLYLPHELKKVLLDYVTAFSLAHPRDPKFLKLDPVLSDSLLKKGEMLDVMTKDDVHKRLKDGCVRFYSLRKAGEEVVIKKGTPPVVRIAMKSVGKRMVTLISGYEAWDLSGEELAADLKLAAASSTAIQAMAGCSPKKPIFEIMVQGSHEALVTKILTEKGLPKSYIEVDRSKPKR